MSDGQVGRVLYREILRWARKADGVPLRVRSEDVRLLLPKAQTASDTVAELQLLQQQQQAASPRFISYEIRRLTRVGFKSGSLWEVTLPRAATACIRSRSHWLGSLSSQSAYIWLSYVVADSRLRTTQATYGLTDELTSYTE